jgi:hypothetical protein
MRGGRTTRWAGAVALLLVADVVGLAVVGSSGAPGATRSDPCAAAVTPAAPAIVDLRATTQNSLLVPVCIDGKGPFHLVLDTGATNTAITPALAHRLGLVPNGAGAEFLGVGRPQEGRPVWVDSWSMGRVRLLPQPVFVTSGLGGTDGLLGSDVLSRMGAIQLDYDTAQLTVAGAEGPRAARSVVRGRASVRLPAFIAAQQPQATLPLVIANFGGTAVASIPVTVGPRRLNLELDSGAEASTIRRSVAAGLQLRTEENRARIVGVGGTVTAALERVDAWSAESVRLVPQDVAVLDLPSFPGDPGPDGLLGSDVLSQFRVVAIDYRDAALAVEQVPVV